MADGCHFENSFIAISSRKSSDLNEIWCADAYCASKVGYVTKCQNYSNSKWRTAAILKIVFWLYLNEWFITPYKCDFFFSDEGKEETPGRILTRNGWKDAESLKDVPFWGYKMKNWNLTPIYPQNPKNLPLNRQFPAKMMKHETPSISESAKPINRAENLIQC